MALTKAKVSFIEGLTGAQLTGAMPAVDGSALTGILGMTKTTSDPAIDTNPSTGLGTCWVNKSSGEMFICTDATTDENVWTNVGDGSGNIVKTLIFQGSIAGYTAGSNSPVATNVIDKYSYTSQANATDVGDLITTGGRQAGHKSETHGYASGGNPAGSNIEKYSFASDGNAVDAGYDLSVSKIFGAGASSLTHGYSAGGSSSGSVATGDTIDKFSYSGSSNATDVGNLSQQRSRPSGHTSQTHGYIAGGANAAENTFYNVIDKYSFASNGNATDVGDLTTLRATEAGGSSSTTHGFCSGGYKSGGSMSSNVIDKWSFASDGNATDVGDLLSEIRHGVNTSSTTHSYTAGGFSTTNVIQRHAYASSGNTVDWADLTVSRFQGCSSQI
jgi:hypothetical protein